MRCRNGYSLVELICVMAIIVIIGALASPLVFQGMDGPTRVNAAADVVRSGWADCRTHAIEEGQMYKFSVIPNSGKYRIELCTDGLQSAGWLAPDPAAPNGAEGGGAAEPNASPQGYVMEGRLPSGVRFGTKDAAVDPHSEEADSGSYEVIAVFLPDGSASDDAQIVFGTGGASSVTIKLSKMTGSATTVRNKGDGN